MNTQKHFFFSIAFACLLFIILSSVQAKGSLVIDSIYATALEGNLLGDPVKREITIYLPSEYGTSLKKYPVIYLLHTGGGNNRFYPENEFPPLLEATGMFTKPQDFPDAGFVSMIDSLIYKEKIRPMIIVMPNINSAYGGSFCVNSALNGNYEDYVVNDLVAFVDSNYRTLPDRDSRAIAGHCMGGYGATYLAMKHPDVFGALAGHSTELCIDALARACQPYIAAENPEGITGPEPLNPAKTFTNFMYMFSAAYSPDLSNPPYYVDLPFDEDCNIREEVFLRWANYDPIQMLPDHIADLQTLNGIYYDVGNADELQSSYFLTPFVEALNTAGITNSFEVYEGTHFSKLYTRLGASLEYLSEVLVHSTEGPTEIDEGNVSGTWSAEGSPYHIKGEITIPDGETLVIEPGVKIVFKGQYKFKIDGRLLAIGTEEDTIVFTADDQATGWHGLHFEYTKTSNDTSKLVHCELKYGKASGTFPDDFGGAILVASCSKLIISNCYIHHNTATGGGGGIVLGYGSDPVITNNIFSYNETQYGGGLCIVDHCTPVVANNIFHNNSASVIGGGININQYSNPVLFNNTITQNSAGSGGGLSCRDNSDPAIVNTIIYGNTSANGSQVYLYVKNCDPHFFNCNIEEGLGGFRGPGSGSEYTGTYSGNLDHDPEFANVLSYDFHIAASSPCIGAGVKLIEFNGKSYEVPGFDFDHDPRPCPAESKPDIGAMENSLGSPLFVDSELKNRNPFPEHIMIYPNPFSNSTTISYELISSGPVSISIFDVNGRVVKVLFEEIQSAGTHKLTWQPENLLSGIYYCRMLTGEYTVTRKLLLIE